MARHFRTYEGIYLFLIIFRYLSKTKNLFLKDLGYFCHFKPVNKFKITYLYCDKVQHYVDHSNYLFLQISITLPRFFHPYLCTFVTKVQLTIRIVFLSKLQIILKAFFRPCLCPYLRHSRVLSIRIGSFSKFQETFNRIFFRPCLC